MFSLRETIAIQKYFNQKKEFHNLLLKFIENSDANESDFQNLIEFIKKENFQENREEFEHYLQLILKVANNHHRTLDFNKKIEQIFVYFKNDIKQTFSNFEIFNIFKNNKLILLILLTNKIFDFDEITSNLVIETTKFDESNYSIFFSPEIKSFIDEAKTKEIEDKFSDTESSILDNFEEKRHKGENDSPICSLIRNDSLDEFIEYVNQNNLSITSTIQSSIYETNPFLIKNKETTLIEYAAFFGSIKILQYLKSNNVELTPSLWTYAIHSQSLELIHLLDENHVEPEDKSYEKCYEEAIKCHHNDIANCILSIIQNQDNENDQITFNENIVECSFRYYNYPQFPAEFTHNFAFYYLCRYNYSTVVNLLMKIKKSEIETMIIQNFY